MSVFPRKTVAQPVEFDGFGLHSGVPVSVTVHPGQEGIIFRSGSVRTPARPEHITETKLCTRLGEVATIEHLMAAFAGLGVTDAEVEVRGPELPALDGASAAYVEALSSSGFELIGEREYHPLFTRIFKVGGSSKIALGSGTGHWRYVFHSPNRYPFDQSFEVKDLLAEFRSQIAPARTFGWADDLVELERLGLAKGLTEETGVLLGSNSSLTDLKFPDEPARHKLLDAMGDIYLAGVPLNLLNFHGDQSGHRLNVEAAKHLYEAAFGMAGK
jgi:UDP-3-O-[3-hydroxymyristoyl] N-acetylglucosamine deacetylase